MRKVTIGLALLALSGCSNPAKDAEAEYNIVAVSGDDDAKCVAAQKVRDAWLREKDQRQYGDWQLTARIACTTAAINVQNRALLTN